MATATLGASLAVAGGAQAAGTTFTVTGTGDTGGSCDTTTNECTTLRAAIAQATSGSDTITFANGVSGTIDLGTDGPLDIANGLTINGPGAGTLSVSGAGNSYVFDITAASGAQISISGLTITDGSGDDGGAIANNGSTLSLASDAITGSTAATRGGGIWTRGPLTITDSTISGDSADDEGGGIYVGVTLKPVDVTITNTTIGGTGNTDGNTAVTGGGIGGDANFSITNSSITGNTASDSEGGGIYARGGGLDVTGSVISGNTASGSGGGIWASTKYGTTVKSSTISGNTASGGGGIELGSYGGSSYSEPVLVQNSMLTGNKASEGAGIEVARNHAQSPVTIQASTLSGNQGSGGNSFGGGLRIKYMNSPFDMIDSTISGNSATNGGGVSLGDNAFFPLNGPSGTGSITFDNSTIAANTADTNGGGIYLGAPQQFATDAAVVRDAPATTPVGGTAAINSTIVAGNQASSAQQDLYQASTTTGDGFDASYSLIQNSGNAQLLTTNQLITGKDAQLGALANNGGPTLTMLPADTSPAIDQGKAADGLTTDQRGDARTVDRGVSKPPGGDGTDIGAVELPAIVKPGSSATAATASTPAPVAAPTPISAIVDPATGITMSHATLNGKINTNGVAVTWHFQWGTTTGYGQTTPSQSISAGHGQVPVSFQVSGLKPGTVYHYRVVAVGSGGQTATSSDATFKTPAPTINDHPGTVLAGKKTRVFGNAGGCPTGDQVTLMSDAFSAAHQFAGTNAIFATVLPGDRYSVVTRIPATRVPDRYAITGRCGGGNFGVSASLRVLAVKHVKAVKVTFTG